MRHFGEIPRVVRPVRSQHEPAGGAILGRLNGYHAPAIGGASKRAFDIVASSAGLVFLLPVLILVVLSVKLTSKGPVLFWSHRIGRDGELFLMPKFRTMRINTPVMAREDMPRDGACFTPIGGFLRRSSIDELPQLISVLSGRMSLIGPRPLLLTDPAARERLARPVALLARPGISGLAQVRGRNLVTARRKAQLDEAYARRWSWMLDLRILTATLLHVLTGRNVL